MYNFNVEENNISRLETIPDVQFKKAHFQFHPNKLSSENFVQQKLLWQFKTFKHTNPLPVVTTYIEWSPNYLSFSGSSLKASSRLLTHRCCRCNSPDLDCRRLQCFFERGKFLLCHAACFLRPRWQREASFLWTTTWRRPASRCSSPSPPRPWPFASSEGPCKKIMNL